MSIQDFVQGPITQNPECGAGATAGGPTVCGGIYTCGPTCNPPTCGGV